MLAAMDSLGLKRLDGRIALARLAVGFERLWAALLWPLATAALALSLVVSGLLPALPAAPRLGLAAILAVLFLWSLRAAIRLAWPTRMAAMRRIETASGLAHRPVSSHNDRLSAGETDAAKQAIWQEHKLRQLGLLANLKVGRPRSDWRELDPRALRVPAALAVVASLLLGQGSPAGNLADSLRLTPRLAAAGTSLDAWLKPPAYTGRAPLMLTSPAMAERLKAGGEVLVPENSMLTLRLSGAAAPKIKFHAVDENGGAIEDLVGNSRSEAGLFHAETRLDRPVLVTVSDGGTELARWRIRLIPDSPPEVAMTADPAGDSSGALTVKWEAGDDYGVSAVTAEISLSDSQDDGLGIDGNGIFLYEPPKFPITLRRTSPKHEAASTTADLSEHPWAGFMVEMTLTATDAAGHATVSAPRTFRLPERLFTKLIARSLIEQRRHLIVKPEESGRVEGMLGALLAYPEGLIDSSGNYLAIAVIDARLGAARGQEDVDRAVAMLWRTAVGIEDGTLADARAELEALRKELERALAEGASPERIAELMDKLRGAMDRYIQSLLDETQKRLQQGNLDPNQQFQQGRPISPEDLQKMLDMIEKLAESGANDAAREMLSQLEDILRNLQPGMNAQQMAPQRDTPMGRMLDQLSDLMRRQQRLMDDTQRMQEGEGDELSERQGEEPGNSGQRFDPDSLANEQGGLAQLLEQLMRELGKNGLNAPPQLGDAGKNMRGAEGSLREPDRDGALRQQGEALAKLRQGAQGMARQLMQQGVGQEGNYGRHGEARGDDRDPLGRPMPHSGEDYGPDRNILPGEQAIRRAREILETLRSRVNEPELPRLDRDYIERLLRGLY
jgi:uncharacterized protein (TIGR02302 family)